MMRGTETTLAEWDTALSELAALNAMTDFWPEFYPPTIMIATKMEGGEGISLTPVPIPDIMWSAADNPAKLISSLSVAQKTARVISDPPEGVLIAGVAFVGQAWSLEVKATDDFSDKKFLEEAERLGGISKHPDTKEMRMHVAADTSGHIYSVLQVRGQDVSPISSTRNGDYQGGHVADALLSFCSALIDTDIQPQGK